MYYVNFMYSENGKKKRQEFVVAAESHDKAVTKVVINQEKVLGNKVSRNCWYTDEDDGYKFYSLQTENERLGSFTNLLVCECEENENQLIKI